MALHIRGSNGAIIGSATRLGVFCTLGNFLKPLATINLPKSLTFLCNFCKGVKIYHFYATFTDIWRFLSGHTDHRATLVVILPDNLLTCNTSNKDYGLTPSSNKAIKLTLML